MLGIDFSDLSQNLIFLCYFLNLLHCRILSTTIINNNYSIFSSTVSISKFRVFFVFTFVVSATLIHFSIQFPGGGFDHFVFLVPWSYHRIRSFQLRGGFSMKFSPCLRSWLFPDASTDNDIARTRFSQASSHQINSQIFFSISLV